MFTPFGILGLARFVSAVALVGSHPTPLATTTSALREQASPFAGSSVSFQFPPANMSATFPNPNFPDAEQVGFSGPTPTGDEAFSIATAPAIPVINDVAPIVRPDTFDHKGLNSSFSVVRNWGSISPYASAPPDSFGLPHASPIIPDGCALHQVHIVHRHGARYPSADGGPGPEAFAAKVASTAGPGGAGFSASGPLQFLNTWTFKLGAEILTPVGREELYSLGVNSRVRYGGLLKAFNELPVWRTTSEARMVDSALQFAAGFFGVQEYATSYRQLIEIEETGFNSTLAPFDQCPNANNAASGLGVVMGLQWAENFTLPAIARLQPFLEGFNLTVLDIIGMQTACAYESVALGYSSFCDLFTEDEWIAYEYFWALGFWYQVGPGAPATAAQGIGYVQEFISRLTQTPITTFDTSVNATIVSNNATFPLSQPIFVDATHDTVISAIVVALNLTTLADSGPLPADHIVEDRQWVVNKVVPFAANLVAQVISCPANDTPTHVRWILNDAVVPLTGVQGCPEDKDGLCALETYINGTKARIAEVDYQFDCFANYTVPSPDLIVDGRFPPALRNQTA
ncbi:phosphoglycerate mutase-like protein [Amylostereum chailletii]|nr:phosphoglycerate mutase-like protein [Amylostereum chailletii]